MHKIYDELIISSGGIKGAAIIGALNLLNQNYPIEKFKYLTGCSIGSFLCLCINIGYNLDEINKLFFKINFEIFQDLKILNFIEICGLDDGKKISNFLKALIINKNYDYNITFKELYDKTNKTLTITTVNITSGFPEYHNHLSHPDLSILLSVRMSINIPILFSPILYNNCYYVDGALLDPYPYYCIKNTHKIGIWVFEKEEYNFMNNKSNLFIKNLNNSISYVNNLMKILYVNYMKKYYKKLPKNTIYIDFNLKQLNMSFELSQEQRLFIFNFGIKKTSKFFIKEYKNKRKIFLSKKYFYLWMNKIKKIIS
jgi:predicted patatin/cPLA2 family phospholipase